MTDRRRNALILLVVTGLLILSALAITTKKTRLGLDLRGGVELVYQGKPTGQSAVTTDALNRAIEIMRKRVDKLGVAEPVIQRFGKDEIDVGLPDVSNAARAQAQVGKTAQLYFYDWEPNVIGPSGSAAPSDPTVTGDGGATGSETFGVPEYQAVLRAAKRPAILRKSDTTLEPGCTQAKAQATGCLYGSYYLLDDTKQTVLRGPEQTAANLTADNYRPPVGDKTRVVHINPGTVLVQATPVTNTNGDVTVASPNSYYVIDDNPVLTGSDIRNPAQSLDNGTGGTGEPIVTFDFSSHGKTVFQNVTKAIAHRGQNAQLPGVSASAARQHFAVVLDDQLITVPFIDQTTNPDGIDATNGSQISGGFTISSAQNLADELQSGALPIKLVRISSSQVSATLGKQALNQGLIAGLVGFAIVCLFLLAFYRVLGVVAVGGLLIYGLYFFAMIKLIPITLTLPGIAGLILTIGVAADANIVIFERIKEEIRGGRSVAAGIATGYKRGFAAIVDANVVTFMTAFILFVLATAQVKGFAFTLGIGTLVSLFTAVLATQAALGTMGRSRMISHPNALGAGRKPRQWRYDFMGASKWFFSLSGTILLIGALAIGGKGLNFGIDFRSGTRIQTGFVHPVSENQIRSVLTADHAGDAQIQKFSNQGVGANGYQISAKTLDTAKVQSQLNANPATQTRNYSATSIGPTFGKTIANSAVIAIIASLVVISLYIALRFEWKYAVPVLIALMHDLLITAGVYSLTGREVTTSTVAALLTILGYSLYDTIIVFDRVRENVPRMPRAAFSQIVNRSMSEVLTRSLATSFCTLLPVVSLLLFGGQTLKDFAFALMVGVASGAYSSIFIASPVLTHWKEREPVFRNRRTRIVNELGHVPAYATTSSGEPDDVEPKQRKRRRTNILAPEEPGAQLSRSEFDELVRDLDVEEDAAARSPVGGRTGNGGSGRGGATPAGGAGAATRRRAEREARKAAAEAPEGNGEPAQTDTGLEVQRDPAADALPEDVVMPDQPRPGPRGSRSKRARRRHGRAR
jgi:SecD/SecF fusion protein